MAVLASAGVPDRGLYEGLAVERHFVYPVGPPDGAGYIDAQDFGTNFHLGEDWNRIGADDADLGDAVHAIGFGVVTRAEDHGAGWGRVVRVVHHTRRHGRAAFIESVYAHLDRIDVEPGSQVQRGQRIGTIGDAHGRYSPHLHLEIRSVADLPLGRGYGVRTGGYLDPSAFLDAHR